MSQFAFLTFQSHKKWPGNLSDQSATLLKCLAELSIARSDVEGRSHFIVLPSGHVKIGIFQMAISFVDLPIENGDFPSFFVCLPEGKSAISVVELQGIKQLFSIVK